MEGASNVYTVNETPLHLDQTSVFPKVVPVVLHGPSGDIETHAVLDDESMRTMILIPAVKRLNLKVEPDQIRLSTIGSEPYQCSRYAVTLPQIYLMPNIQWAMPLLLISSHCLSRVVVLNPCRRPKNIHKAFIYPEYRQCRTSQIGSDHAELILPREPVNFRTCYSLYQTRMVATRS